MPRTISKYGRPLPYFMKYASDYYGKLKLSKTRSNMNRLCWELEHWQREIRWKRASPFFDYSIMFDGSVDAGPDKIKINYAVDALYKCFCRDVKQLVEDVKGKSEDERKKAYALLYERYRNEVLAACNGNVKLAANITVWLSDFCKSRNQKFPWIVAGSGIVQNIKQVDAPLPIRDDNGDLEYLGKKYRWAPRP